MTDTELFYFTFMASVAAAGWLLVLAQWLGRRHERRVKKNNAA